MNSTPSVYQSALAAHRAGISVMPILDNGTKSPPIKWSSLMVESATEERVSDWFSKGSYSGYALICGVVSGNLEVFDFDDANTYQAFVDTAESLGLGPLVDRIRSGYEETTPSGGVHLPYRCDTIQGSQKLAQRPVPENPKKFDALIETRGIGGYIIAAPSNGKVHPDGGAWVLSSGGPDTIADITPAERDSLFTLARSFDEVPAVETEPDHERTTAPGDGTRPGDDYRRKHESLHAFRAIVEAHGWSLTHTRGSVGYFRRPDKADGWSATYNHADSKLFYVFSSSTAFEPERGYNPYSVYAILNHSGDFSAASTELARLGYGTKGKSLGVVTVTKRKAKDDAPLGAFDPQPMPDDAITGWFRQYVDLVGPTSEASDSFHMAVSVSILGASIGKRVGLIHASDIIYPNFYTLLIGSTGKARKDTSIKRMIKMFYVPPPQGEPLLATGMAFKIAKDISSSEGLIAMLRKNPNVLLYAAELSKVMSNAERESTGSIGPTLIEAFDTPSVMQNNKVEFVEAGDSKEAKNPFLSVITSVQPEEMARIIGGKHQHSGFLNRWWLIQGKGVGPRANPPFIDETAAWHLLRKALKQINKYQEGTVLKFSDDAADLWGEWYDASWYESNTPEEDDMAVRRGTIVKKIALVHAVMDGAKAIEWDHMRIGIALSDWAWQHTRRLMPTWGESKDAEMERKILERLASRGPMNKRSLQSSVGNRLGPGVFARIIKAMVENGDIAIGDGSMVALTADA